MSWRRDDEPFILSWGLYEPQWPIQTSGWSQFANLQKTCEAGCFSGGELLLLLSGDANIAEQRAGNLQPAGTAKRSLCVVKLLLLQLSHRVVTLSLRTERHIGMSNE